MCAFMIVYELDMFRIDLMSGMSRSCVYLTLHALDMVIRTRMLYLLNEVICSTMIIIFV